MAGTKVVGVLGGMGPLAGHAFLGCLLEATQARADQDYLRIVVDIDPGIPDRTAFLLGTGDDPRPRICSSAQRLVSAGAQLLVMPCNTASAFVEDVQPHIGAEFLDWIGTVVRSVRGRGVAAVGLLATTGTVVTGIYQRALSRYGIRVLVPNAAGQELVMGAIYGCGGAKSGVVSATRRLQLLSVAAELEAAGAEAVILGCTELPLVVPSASADWPLPAINPERLVASATVAQAGGQLAESWKE